MKLKIKKKSSVIDFPRKTLCPEIFDISVDPPSLLPEVENKICDIVLAETDFISGLEIKGIYLIGSLTTYNYTDTSDIDITVIVDKEFLEILRKKAVEINGTEFINKHPINFFFRENLKITDNAYDIISDLWIKFNSVKDTNNPEERFQDIWKRTEQFIEELDIEIGRLSRDVQDAERYRKYLEDLDLNEEEKLWLQNALVNKLNEIEDDIDILLKQYDLKHEDRKRWLEEPPNETIEGDLLYGEPNVAWKFLERYHYYQFLVELKRKVKGQENELLDNVVGEILENRNLKLEKL